MKHVLKKCLAAALLTAALLCLASAGLAEDAIVSGSCGDSLSYALVSDGGSGYKLLVAGSGDMADGALTDIADYRGQITEIVLSNRISYIGSSAFAGFTGLTSVVSQDTVDLPGEPGPSGPAIVASGDCGDQGGNVTWTLDENGLLTVSGTGNMASYTNNVPWRNWDYKIVSANITSGVTSIGSGAFLYCEALESVTIPDGVTAIGEYAFGYCESLASAAIPSGVTAISDNTFYGCLALASVTIPDGVASIGESAFDHCLNLSDVTIPGSVASIGFRAFDHCDGIVSVTIPSGAALGERAFANCEGLVNVTISEGVTSIAEDAFSGTESLAYFYCYGNTYAADWAMNYLEPYDHIHIIVDSAASEPDCTHVGHAAGRHCLTCDLVISGYDEVPALGHDSIIVATPATESANGEVKHVCSRCNVSTEHPVTIKRKNVMTLPASLTVLGEEALSGVHTPQITLPDGLLTIDSRAFADCSYLLLVVIPASVTSIADDAFSGSSRVTLLVSAGSAAEAFAARQSIPCALMP